MKRSRKAPGACHSAAASGALAVSVCALLGAPGARAADVSYERLLNPEPQNWLMNHHDYGSRRFSPLDVINKSNVKRLVPIWNSSLMNDQGELAAFEPSS